MLSRYSPVPTPSTYQLPTITFFLPTLSPSPSPSHSITIFNHHLLHQTPTRQRDMEDAVSVHPSFLRRGAETEEFHFFGVFDGHGCSHVATSCKDRMHEMLAEELEAMPPPASLDLKDAMEKAAVVSRHPPKASDCRCELQLPKCDHVGSTAVVAVVGSEQIVIGNCGDSRNVLCRKGVPIPLSVHQSLHGE